MSSDFDPEDFVDSDFQARKTAGSPSSGFSNPRAPTREELDSKAMEAQQKLAELKRAQEELERERATLEEARRRRREFETGREEMLQNLTRGIGLLEEAEFVARRDAEQMAKAIVSFRDALAKIEVINQENWSAENFNVELTRSLTTIENARMEWNAARLKFPVLAGQNPHLAEQTAAEKNVSAESPFANRSFAELCRLGLALTWPLALVALAALAAFLIVLFRR
ncbi:MAG TPA: hypothetical protein VFM25_11440 [Verrucomicrobiae bacterium]|nr:hypothetical protein [Verrucomicrobiae bacterium]